MSRRIVLLWVLGMVLTSCTGSAEEGSPTTVTTAPVSTTAPPSSSTTTTMAPGPADTLGADLADPEIVDLSGQLFEDPLAGSGMHRMALDDERGVLLSEDSLMGSGAGQDLLGLGPVLPPPQTSGIDPYQVLLEAWIDGYTGDIVPTATVLYTLDEDGWFVTSSIPSAAVEAALLDTTDYAAVAPDGPVGVDTSVSVFDWTARLFRADVAVFDYLAEYRVVYEGEIECTIGDPLECTTLSDDGVLRPGDEGEDVEALQTDLATLGYFAGNVNGDYEEETTAAVSAFQVDYLLTVDGKAGPQTLGLLGDIVSGESDLILASSRGIGLVGFGTAADEAFDGLVADLGSPDATTGWYTDACDGQAWSKASWDGFTAIFTDREGSRRLDGWAVDDLNDLPSGLLIAGGIRPTWTWSDFDAAGAEFDPTYGGFFRMTELSYNNGRFVDPPADPPDPDAAISGFGTGTGAFVSC